MHRVESNVHRVESNVKLEYKSLHRGLFPVVTHCNRPLHRYKTFSITAFHMAVAQQGSRRGASERVVVQPGGAARWLCSKARRRCYVDKHGVLVREVSTPGPALKGTPAIGSSKPLALPVNPEPTLLVTSSEVQPDIFPMRNASAEVPHGGSIQVEENSLGLVAVEVVVPAQTCESMQYDPSDSSSVSSTDSTPVMAVVVPAQTCESMQYDASDSSSVSSTDSPPVMAVVVPAQTCESLQYDPSDSSSVASTDSPPVMAVAKQLVLYDPLLVPSSLSLREIFDMYVMCDFTPRNPRKFHTLKWATLEQLMLLLQPYAPSEVARFGPQNLRQLITEWYKEHPAFAGLSFSEWAKRLKDLHPLAHPRSLTYKFCFEFTPRDRRGASL